MSSPLALLLLLLTGAAADPLREAIMGQTEAQLEGIADRVGIDHGVMQGEGRLEALRKAVYEFAQSEKPAGVERFAWDGTPLEADAPAAKAKAAPATAAPAKASSEAQRRLRLKTSGQLRAMLDEFSVAYPAGASKEALLSLAEEAGLLERWEALHPPQKKAPSSSVGLADMLFASLDRDSDGSLSREEMAGLIEKTNAAAKAQGEAVPADFFASIDADGDGRVDRGEASGYFERMMAGGGGAAAGGGAASRSTGGGAGGGGAMEPSAIMRSLDKDGDGRLSREEMASLIQEANGNAANKAAGAGGDDDFFATMDADRSGFVEAAEATRFFEELQRLAASPPGAGGGKADKKEL